MHSTEKQVKELLLNASQSLNFLRVVIDDLLLKRDTLAINSLTRLTAAQENYKKHKAVLINIEKLISEKQYPLPERLANAITKSLRKRISLIIEESIELDKER
ncbi:MAG: hypothetical protein A3B68_05330 [Candidatus Melainabacteria bacterium RIFCSPHIGHO2_02_FULL_34_12]|nr:MAG: hypothetical protein A3B68_05330 [Candidatus Melainabacteria bacterium RIFCSPHIGHO2_02_FULL_34_12]